MAATYKEFLAIKSLFYFCSLPLRLDSYLGCTHGCLYCFSRHLNNRSGAFHRRPRPADIPEFERVVTNALEGKRTRGPVTSSLAKKLPIHFGSVSDPFQPQELVSGASYKMLSILSRYSYPIIICTKSTLIRQKKYLDLILKMPISVQISFSTFDDVLSRKLEPGAPMASKRLTTLKQLSEEGIWTVARLQPFLFPRERLIISVFERLAEAGVKHVVLEHLRIPTNSRPNYRNRLFAALNLDMLEEYERIGKKRSRVSFELSSEAKLDNVIQAKKLANSCGMTFGSGDNDFHHFSDTECCCGLPDREPFNNFYKGHMGIAAYKALRKGKVSFSNIETEWHPEGSLVEYLNHDCRKGGSYCAPDLMRFQVEHPEASNSPLSFWGIEEKTTGGYRMATEAQKIYRNIDNKSNLPEE